MVHDAANLLWGKQPCVRRAVLKVHEPLHVLLDVTPSMFSEVLMLMMGFSVPILNAKGTKKVLGRDRNVRLLFHHL